MWIFNMNFFDYLLSFIIWFSCVSNKYTASGI